MARRQTGNGRSLGEFLLSITKHCRTDEWFSIHLKQTHKLIESVPGALASKPGLRPRIAILDTGLNTKHPDIKKVMDRKGLDRRFQDFWSPVEAWKAKEDEDGHGTHCAMVAHKVAPNADIFIARVFKDRKSVNGIHVVNAGPP